MVVVRSSFSTPLKKQKIFLGRSSIHLISTNKMGGHNHGIRTGYHLSFPHYKLHKNELVPIDSITSQMKCLALGLN